MPRLPTPGSGSWGTILNDYLSQSLDSDGSLKDNTVGSAQLQAGAVTKTDVGLSDVDNTSDVNKPISTATQTALDAKLTASSNLSDLGSAPAARTNLGLGSAATMTPTTLAADSALTGAFGPRGSRFRAAAAQPFPSGIHPSPPTLTTSTTSMHTANGLTTNTRMSTSAATKAKFRVVGGISQTYGANMVAYSYTMSDGAGGNTLGDSTKQSYVWSTEFFTDGGRLQIGIMARTAGFMLYVDDYPVSATTLATTTNYGGTSYTLIDFTVGSATITASTGIFTTSNPHGLIVGDTLVLGAITATTGVTANTTYYVLTTPNSTTFTLSTTLGGSPLSLTGDGSTAGVSKRAVRKIRVENNNGAFFDVYTAPTSSLYPTKGRGIRVCTVGDSVDAQTGSTLPIGGWQGTAARLLGWDDVRIVSFGGTGFTTAALHGNTFGSAQRVADVVAHNPDLLVITISQNDEPNRNTTLPAARAGRLPGLPDCVANRTYSGVRCVGFVIRAVGITY